MYFPEDGAAPAAAEPSLTSQGAEAQSDTGTGQAESAIDRSRETARDSLDRAFAALEEQDGAQTGNTTSPAPGSLVRDEQGRFRATTETDTVSQLQYESTDGKQPVATTEAPARFSADAKAVWRDVPDSVKGEVGRAFRELEGGLNQYQQAFEPLKPYFHMAEQRGVTVADALANYVGLDRALTAQEPQQRLAAIEHLLGYAGVSPREYAAFIMGQPVDQAQIQHDQTIRELRQHIASLENQLGGVTQSIQQRHEDEVLQHVEAFAEANARLKEPEFQMAVSRLLETGLAADLQSAYDMATRLNPAPVETAHPVASTAANRRPGAAQTRNGNLSITGAPSSGSNPAKRKAPATARDSVDSAFASLGLG
jgi:DNA-binding transcriptional MerR regulator